MAILGGAKVSDKIEVIENLGKVVDRLLIGGAMAYTFLKAQGKPTGQVAGGRRQGGTGEEAAGRAGRQADAAGGSRGGVGDRGRRGQRSGGDAFRTDKIGGGYRPEDHRSSTRHVIAGAKTIIWNGPMGIFEKPPFDKGTVALAKAVAESGATSVVGGGDSEKAIKAAGVTDKITPRFHRRRRVAGISGGDRAARRGRARNGVGRGPGRMYAAPTW